MTNATKDLKVINKRGIHARTAGIISETVSEYDAEVTLSYKDKTVEADSILDLMLLSARCGALVTASANGTDSEQALLALEKVFLQRFGED